MYGGTNLKYQKWKISDNMTKLFLCDAKKFQSELIFMLYFQTNKETNYLYLPHDISQKDIEQITSFQADSEKRNGNLLENWTPKDKVHDMFDTLKMAIACFQISAKIYKRDKFKYGEARLLNQTKQPKKIIQQKTKANRNPLFRY